MANFTFDKANKLVIVDITSTEVTCQEIVNKVRDWSDNQGNIEVGTFMYASGKEDLGGSVLVGITVLFIEWKLKFADRPGSTWVICNVTGGNLVGQDADGNEQNPIEPSSYVTVTKTSSSSATISTIELQELYYFGKVWVNTSGGGTSGTEFPTGTTTQPSDNIVDAKTIADALGIKLFHIHGNVTLNDTFEGYIFESHNVVASVIILNNQSIEGSVFNYVTISGQCNGGIQTNKCVFNGVTDVHGFFTDTDVSSNISLSAGEISRFFRGTSLQYDVIDVDLNGTAMISFLECSGRFNIKNMTSPAALFASTGITDIYLDNSITAGYVYIAGNTNLVENNATGFTYFENKPIWSKVWDEGVVNHTTSDSFGAELGNLYDSHWNKKVLTKINDNEYKEELYDDAGSVVIRTHTLTKVGDVETRE